MDTRRGFAADVPRLVEEEFDPPFRVIMPAPAQEALHPDPDAEFLTKLTRQAGFGRFARLDFSAGKLPHAGQGIIPGAAGNENAVAPPDDSGRDLRPAPATGPGDGRPGRHGDSPAAAARSVAAAASARLCASV